MTASGATERDGSLAGRPGVQTGSRLRRRDESEATGLVLAILGVLVVVAITLGEAK